MNVILLNPPGQKLYLRDQYCSFSSKSNYYWPPIDLLIQSGILSQKYKVIVIDAIAECLTPNECLKRIILSEPSVILCVTGISSFISDFNFLKTVRKSTKPLVFLTGGFLLSEFEQVLRKHSFIDGVLLDFTSNGLLDFLDGKEAVTDLAYIQNDKVIARFSSPKRMSYPTPKHELFPLKRYRLPHGRGKLFSCVITNYGCPFRCAFCIAQSIQYKVRPILEIISELIYLKSIGVDEAFIKDFTFGVEKQQTIDLCYEIKNHVNISWICASRVDVIDEELLAAMKAAGCHTIQFGIETPNEALLEKYNKGISSVNVENAFKLCRKYGIRTLGHFILGFPGESRESINNTIKYAKKIGCDYASFNIATPLPGTLLRIESQKNNIIGNELNELDLSDGNSIISDLALEKIIKKAYRSFYLRPSYIIKRLFSIRSKNELISLFREGLSILKKNI